MAVFGLKYWAEMRSKYQGLLWRCEIAQRGYTGGSEEMTFSGVSPIKVTWERRGDDFYTPVKASEASININCTENFRYLGLFTSDPREYRMSLYRNGSLFWRGFIVADLYSEKFAAPPYDVTIKAVDGFNILSNIDFKDILGIGTTGKKTIYSLLSTCISLLELDMSVSQWLDLIPEGLADTTTPLLYVQLDLERLFYVYEEPTYRDILELCLAPFGAQIFQMMSIAALILLVGKADVKVAVKGNIFGAGMSAMVSIFGIAWMGDTFFNGNIDFFRDGIAQVVSQYPFLFAVALFLMSIMLFSKAATVRTLYPLGIALGISPLALVAMFPAVNGYFFIPNYPTEVAAINFDTTGTTRIGKYVINHSFQLAGFITTFVSIGIGYLIITFLY